MFLINCKPKVGGIIIKLSEVSKDSLLSLQFILNSSSSTDETRPILLVLFFDTIISPTWKSSLNLEFSSNTKFPFSIENLDASSLLSN